MTVLKRILFKFDGCDSALLHIISSFVSTKVMLVLMASLLDFRVKSIIYGHRRNIREICVLPVDSRWMNRKDWLISGNYVCKAEG